MTFQNGICLLPALLLLLLLSTHSTASLPPCDPDDATTLCLKPLRRYTSPVQTEASLPSTQRRHRRGSRRIPGAAAAAGAVFGSGRRPGRGSRRPDFDDDDDDDDDINDIFFEDEPECFPASALVSTPTGRVPLSELSVGDVVLSKTEDGTTTIHAFTHADHISVRQFLRVRFVMQDNTTGSVEVSKGHYMFASGGMMAAGELRRGDVLEVLGGGEGIVQKIEQVWRRGVFHPQTLEGEMFVQGVRVSVYTTAVEVGVAIGLLTPFRAMYRASGVDLIGRRLRSGMSDVGIFGAFVPRGGKVIGGA